MFGFSFFPVAFFSSFFWQILKESVGLFRNNLIKSRQVWIMFLFSSFFPALLQSSKKFNSDFQKHQNSCVDTMDSV